MNRFRLSWSAGVVLAIVTLIPWTDRTASQEVALTPLEATEVARGYRAETIKLKPVVNDKNETIGASTISSSARTATPTPSLPSAISPALAAT